MLQRLAPGIVLCAACTAGSPVATAATIGFTPTAPTSQVVGTRIAFDITGSDFTDGSAGGGLDLSWDAALLSIASLDDVELLFPGDRFIFDKGTLDTAAGTLTNLSTNSFTGVTDASFSIARITFTTLAPGTSSIDLDLGSFGGGGKNVWTTAAGGALAGLTFEPASLTVVAPVPLPAGLWLLSGALAVLGVRLRAG